MNVSIPLVVVLGAVVWIAWRFMGLRTWQAVICLLLGFLLAATSAAPAIHRAVAQIVRALTGIPILTAELTRLDAELTTVRLDRANLAAAGRATLAAYRLGEPDPSRT